MFKSVCFIHWSGAQVLSLSTTKEYCFWYVKIRRRTKYSGVTEIIINGLWRISNIALIQFNVNPSQLKNRFDSDPKPIFKFSTLFRIFHEKTIHFNHFYLAPLRWLITFWANFGYQLSRILWLEGISFIFIEIDNAYTNTQRSMIKRNVSTR